MAKVFRDPRSICHPFFWLIFTGGGRGQRAGLELSVTRRQNTERKRARKFAARHGIRYTDALRTVRASGDRNAGELGEELGRPGVARADTAAPYDSLLQHAIAIRAALNEPLGIETLPESNVEVRASLPRFHVRLAPGDIREQCHEPGCPIYATSLGVCPDHISWPSMLDISRPGALNALRGVRAWATRLSGEAPSLDRFTGQRVVRTATAAGLSYDDIVDAIVDGARRPRKHG
ncbi:hypothetical protein ACPC54_12435 [Kitasatospora sp. NPDC094028]